MNPDKRSRLILAFAVCATTAVASPVSATAQAIARICQPAVSAPQPVVSAAQRRAAGKIATPPLTDPSNGFAWPDSEFGVLKSATGYTFFASNGGYHAANGKYGSVTRTEGTLDNPLGSDPPVDVIINLNLKENPNYQSYTYLGGGRLLLVLCASRGRGGSRHNQLSAHQPRCKSQPEIAAADKHE